MAKRILALLVVIISLTVVITSQQTGTPSQIRVITDATGALVTSAVSQTLPLSQPVTFTNARLKVDASGNLLVTGTGSSGVTNIATTSPISGGPITTTGTISCPTCGVTSSGLNQFASTTSAQLAGIISDETGSGVLVFATSPTLVTPVLGTPTSVTLTNGTGLPFSGLSLTTPTFAFGTITANNPLQITQTWNNAGDTFTGFIVNITKTANGSNSRLVDFKFGGTSQVWIDNQSQLNTLNDLLVGTNVQFGNTSYVQTGNRSYFHAPSDRDFAIGSNGSGGVEYTIKVGAAPTLTSGWGTGATISGNNSIGRITIGSTPGASAVLTFSQTWTTNAPHCDFNNETAGSLITNVSPTTSAVTITATLTNADKVSYHCIGWQ